VRDYVVSSELRLSAHGTLVLLFQSSSAAAPVPGRSNRALPPLPVSQPPPTPPTAALISDELYESTEPADDVRHINFTLRSFNVYLKCDVFK